MTTDHDHPDTDLTDPHGEAEALRRENERLRAERDRFEAALARACLVGGTTYLIERAEAAEAALAASRAPDPDWTAAARDMLATWDAGFSGEASERRADAYRLLRAGIFAAQAYEDAMASIAPDSAAGYLLRTFLVALIDWKDPQLDHLRAVNRVAASRAPDPVGNAGGCQPGDLLPCPFCGHEASADGYIKYGRPLPDTWWDDGSEITEAFFCNCPSCGIRNVVGQIGYQNRDDAIAAWNRRALPAAPVAEAQPTIGGAELDALVAALRSGEQADMDGCMVKVSRQACEEAASAITALRAQPDWKAMAEPDYCYNPEDWEYTQPWDARHELAESVLDYGRDNEPARVSTLISGPDKWVARVPLDTDGDGEADDWEDRWFDSEEAARAALSDLAKMKGGAA